MERDVTGAGPECVLPSPLQDLNLKVTVMDELVGEVSLMGLPGSAAVSWVLGGLALHTETLGALGPERGVTVALPQWPALKWNATGTFNPFQYLIA